MSRDAGSHEPSTFRSPWWLAGPHLQTIVPALFGRRARVTYRRERWETPDDASEVTPGDARDDASEAAPDRDFIDVDRVVGDAGPAAPTLVVFHGLEGHADSRYVRGLLAAAAARGWHGIAPHFRGCGGTPNRAPRFYHSGDSAEVDWILRRVADERGAAPIVAAGISLGGNMLLKWLGERKEEACGIVRAAAAISAPMDLSAGGASLGRGFNRVYARLFLRTLKAKSRLKLRDYPGLFDGERMEAARDLHAFDDAVTAPVHGFVDADDYWRRASSKPLLRDIAVPTLVLNARDDPFLPEAALPRDDEVSPMVTLDFPVHGGHVGFVSAGADGAAWMPRRVVGYLAAHVDRLPDRPPGAGPHSPTGAGYDPGTAVSPIEATAEGVPPHG